MSAGAAEFEEYDPSLLKYIVSIDIGIINLGVTFCSIHEDYTLNEVIYFELINITNFAHLDEEAAASCTLYHEKTFTDYTTLNMEVHYITNRRLTDSLVVVVFFINQVLVDNMVMESEAFLGQLGDASCPSFEVLFGPLLKRPLVKWRLTFWVIIAIGKTLSKNKVWKH